MTNPQLSIQTVVVSPYEQNCRIITNHLTQTTTIIDPGADADRIIQHADPTLYPIESIYLTHCHIDHCGGTTHLLHILETKFNQKPLLYYHSADIPLAQAVDFLARERGWGPNCHSPKPADIDLKNLSDFFIGKTPAKILFTPGHAPGHCALFIPEITIHYQDDDVEGTLTAPILFAGDALFKQSIGRTDLPFGNLSDLLKSIKAHFLTLPETTLVLSGHGPITTIGDEKKNNPFLKRLST